MTEIIKINNIPTTKNTNKQCREDKREDVIIIYLNKKNKKQPLYF